MLFLAKLIGFLVAAFGFTLFALPQFTEKVFDFMKEGKRLYWAGVVRALIGLILLMVSPGSVVPLATVSVGTLFLLSAIIVFACELEKLRSFFAHYAEIPALVTRLLGLVMACFGILIFSLV